MIRQGLSISKDDFLLSNYVFFRRKKRKHFKSIIGNTVAAIQIELSQSEWVASYVQNSQYLPIEMRAVLQT
jgi:hypothetical protein